MKKSILFVFALIPLLASCNRSENGFVNPFPEDEPPIGFNVQEEGKIVRSLTSQETSLINETIRLGRENNLYKEIKEESITIKKRDYTRAFAGVFAQGYSSSNQKIDETTTIYRQDPDESNIKYLRNVTENESTTLYDFSYGRTTISDKTKTYHYLASSNANESVKYVETNTEPTCTFEQKYINDLKDPESKRLPHSSSEGECWYEPDIQISQDEFIFNPSDATSLPGVNSEDKPVLIKELHKPYAGKEEGVYELEDGRKYRAAQNELYVTTLNLIRPSYPGEGTDWYIVERSRHYIEAAITSDVIQPNVPISYLAHPIVIAYSEEIFNFSNVLKKEHKTQDPETMPEVTLEENKI